MCLGMFLFGFILYGTLCLLDLIGYFLFHVAEILSIIFSNIFSYPFFFSSSSVQVSSVQFSHSVVSDSLRAHESQHARPLSITNSRSSLRLTSIASVTPSSHLILGPLLLLPPIPLSIRVFSSESTLHMRWPKYWSFSFSIIPSKEIPGLISFRMD